jgi:hypothetical protein
MGTEKGRLHGQDLPDMPAADVAEGMNEGRVEAVVEGFHQRPARFFCRARHGHGLIRIHGEGLLAQHSLAGFQGGYGEVGMPVRGQGVVDQVHIVPGDQSVIAFRHMLDSMLAGIGGSAPGIAGGHDDDPAVRPAARRSDDGKRRNLRRP